MKWSEGVRLSKDPDSKLDYTFDWSDWLDTDTISSHTVTPQSGLTVVSSSTDPTSQKIVVWLSGGTAGETYTLKCNIHTTAGRVDERTVTIVVEDE